MKIIRFELTVKKLNDRIMIYYQDKNLDKKNYRTRMKQV